MVHNAGYDIIQQEKVDTSVLVGSGYPWIGSGSEPQWDKITSKAYGHTVSDHGSNAKASRMQDRANSQEAQGQWYNDEDIIEAENATPKHPGYYIIDFHRPLGRVFVKGGSADNPIENVTRAFIQRRDDGTLNTTYPVTDDFRLTIN